jgi:hypothetical protein
LAEAVERGVNVAGIVEGLQLRLRLLGDLRVPTLRVAIGMQTTPEAEQYVRRLRERDAKGAGGSNLKSPLRLAREHIRGRSTLRSHSCCASAIRTSKSQTRIAALEMLRLEGGSVASTLRLVAGRAGRDVQILTHPHNGRDRMSDVFGRNFTKQERDRVRPPPYPEMPKPQRRPNWRETTDCASTRTWTPTQFACWQCGGGAYG